MSTPIAMSAAVIYTVSLEEPLLTTKKLVFYRRFIDDTSIIWSGTLSDL